MVKPRRAALPSIQERGAALGVDVWQVPRQESACSTHSQEHSPAQRRVGREWLDSKEKKDWGIWEGGKKRVFGQLYSREI